MMKTRRLGTQGLVVSQLGLGCMGMSIAYGAADQQEAIATIHRAIELGITLFDTADAYGAGANEQLLGRAIANRSDQIILATKFGIAAFGENYQLLVNGRPEYVHQACDTSLQHLGVDHIDLYYQHRVDPNVPIEETVGAMAELVQQGKVRYLGLSEASAAEIRRAHAIHPISAVQTEYSLWSRDPEREIIPTLQELGIGLVPYSPMGRGFLSGAITSPDDLAADDFRRSLPRFQGDNFYKNLQLVDRVKQLATQKGVTPGQLALAWLLAQGETIVPIPGTKRRSYVEENAAATHITLTAEDLAQIAAVFPQEDIAGDRYTTVQMNVQSILHQPSAETTLVETTLVETT
ncbi:MAG TPA: aldo/keto reductase [Coleofasciculaceae cyanobacterium]